MIMKVPGYMVAGGSQINNDLLRFFMAVLDGASNVEENKFSASISKTDLVRQKKHNKHLPKVF